MEIVWYPMSMSGRLIVSSSVGLGLWGVDLCCGSIWTTSVGLGMWCVGLCCGSHSSSSSMMVPCDCSCHWYKAVRWGSSGRSSRSGVISASGFSGYIIGLSGVRSLSVGRSFGFVESPWGISSGVCVGPLCSKFGLSGLLGSSGSLVILVYSLIHEHDRPAHLIRSRWKGLLCGMVGTMWKGSRVIVVVGRSSLMMIPVCCWCCLCGVSSCLRGEGCRLLYRYGVDGG